MSDTVEDILNAAILNLDSVLTDLKRLHFSGEEAERESIRYLRRGHVGWAEHEIEIAINSLRKQRDGKPMYGGYMPITDFRRRTDGTVLVLVAHRGHELLIKCPGRTAKAYKCCACGTEIPAHTEVWRPQQTKKYVVCEACAQGWKLSDLHDTTKAPMGL